MKIAGGGAAVTAMLVLGGILIHVFGDERSKEPCPCTPKPSKDVRVACPDPNPATTLERHRREGDNKVERADKARRSKSNAAQQLAEEAIAQYQCVLAVEESAEVWGNIAWAYEIAGDYNRQWEALIKFLKLSDERPPAVYFQRGQIYCNRGMPKQALGELDLAVELTDKKKNSGPYDQRIKYRQHIRDTCF